MKIGLLLHPERGIDAVFEEAQQADREGFHSVWLSDHLASPFRPEIPYEPWESFTLMTAIGTLTSRTCLAWAMLNLSFRRPVVLAKMLATLDHITKGRVICAVGSGWFKEEYQAYDVPLVDDHDDRSAYGREVIRMFKHVWTHPTPESVDFEGKFVHVRNLEFSPAPFQRPHPPIWFGGDSDATLESVKELADGWVMLTSGNQARLAEVTSAPDWPTRPMELVKNVRIHVAETREAAIEEAAGVFARGIRIIHPTFEEFLAREVVGTPEECVAKLKEFESWGITCVRTNCIDAAHQERVATTILPQMAE